MKNGKLLRQSVGDILAGLVLVGLAWYVVTASAAFRGGAGLVPSALGYLIGAGGLALVVLAIVRAVLRGRSAGPPDPNAGPVMTEPPEAAPAPASSRLEAILLPAGLLALTVGFVYLLPRLGFYISSALYIPGVLALLGIKKFYVYVLTVIFFLAVLYIVFDLTFNIPLPRATWL